MKDAFAQSFDCKKASTSVEEAICSNQSLGLLDGTMAKTYFAIINTDISQSTKQSLLNDQREWLSSRESVCQEPKNNMILFTECLKNVYLTRIKYFSVYTNLASSNDSTASDVSITSNASDYNDIIDYASTANDSSDYSSLYEKIKNYVVVVISSKSYEDFLNQQSLTQGSGVLVSSNLVATNCHVLENNEAFMIIKNEKIYPASIDSARYYADACTLKISKGNIKEFLPSNNLGALSSIKVGKPVVAIGSPRGLENTLSTGVISGIRKDGRTDLIQTTAAISSGSSGGGLFDLKGNLLGITTLQVIDSQSINFAVPIDVFDLRHE